MYVLGRTDTEGQASDLGWHRAPDGSQAAPVAIDLEHPHAGLVVGKRGSGKSHSLAVIAEGLATAEGVTGVVIDPMGGLTTLDDLAGVQLFQPMVQADAVPPRAWCGLLEVDPAGAVGSLIWRVASEHQTLPEMLGGIQASAAADQTIRAAENHLRAAEHWNIFDPDGITATDLLDSPLTVVDLSTHAREPANAVVRAIVDSLYERAVTDGTIPLPWVLLDEAHAFFDGVAAPGIHRLLTRGRHPGISTILATQRPTALPPVAISQADLLLTHRLTATADLDALDAARPTYLRDSLQDRRPTDTGDALIIDDATEVARAITIRDRHTPDGGASPTATQRNPSPNTNGE